MAATDEDPNETQTKSKVNFGSAQEEPTEKHKSKKVKDRMTKFLLKFPKINVAFSEMKKAFEQFGEANSQTSSTSVGFSVSPDRLGDLLIELGITVPEEQVETLFNFADFDGNKLIEFRECLIAAGLAVLDPATYSVTLNTENESFKKMKTGYQVIKDMWETIKREGQSSITFEDLCNVFGAMNDKTMVENRMTELDFDTNNEIDFPEFIYGIAAWVGFEDEEDEN